jgi:hypothetical protein
VVEHLLPKQRVVSSSLIFRSKRNRQTWWFLLFLDSAGPAPSHPPGEKGKRNSIPER